MKPVIIIAIAFVLLIPNIVFADEQLSKYGIDVFTNKGIYQVGDDIEIYINLDQERFETYQRTQIQIWEATHTQHDVLVDPLETYTFKHTLDDSFVGEVKVLVRSGGYHDETFFFVGIDTPTLDDLIHDRSSSEEYYVQESNPEDYVSKYQLLKINNELSVLIPILENTLFRFDEYVENIYNKSEFSINHQKMTLNEAISSLDDHLVIQETSQVCYRDARDYEDAFFRQTILENDYVTIQNKLEPIMEKKFKFCRESSGVMDLNNVGTLLARDSQYAEAEKYFDYAITADTRYGIPLVNKAILINLNGDQSQALELLRKAQSIDQNSVNSFLLEVSIGEPETISPPAKTEQLENICGTGTIEKNGICVPDYPDTKPSSKGGGCLIATATYGSELAPQVQQLRELRDNQLLNTESGTSFINSFNDFYYSFSPIIADYERENPVFKEMVKIAITPMISSLSILNYVDMDSELEVLGYGISLIVLNLAMYVGIPAAVIVGIRRI